MLEAISGFDPDDPFSRRADGFGSVRARNAEKGTFSFGVPRLQDREFFGNSESAQLFNQAIERLQGLGGTAVEIDLAPFLEVGRLLFSGPWLAERLFAVRDLIEKEPDALLPVIRDILRDSRKWSALDAFEYFYQLRKLRRRIDTAWQDIDVLVVPTSGTAYSIAEIQQDPVRLNNHLGHYSYFVNLVEMCAVSVPNGFLPTCGVAMGITMIGRRWHDAKIARLASAYHNALGIVPGMFGKPSARPRHNLVA
ncbi:MAG: amidase family protein [Alphaproteobacteria bacterium]